MDDSPTRSFGDGRCARPPPTLKCRRNPSAGGSPRSIARDAQRSRRVQEAGRAGRVASARRVVQLASDHLAPAARARGASPRALRPSERQAVLDILHSDRFVDQLPAEIHATLLQAAFTGHDAYSGEPECS